jgi:hypothetical protein
VAGYRGVGLRSAPLLNELEPTELPYMPKAKSTAGPMRMQPFERESIRLTPIQPVMPTGGEVVANPQAKKKPISMREEAVRVAKAKLTRRNSLRKQRDALRG